MDIVTKNDLSVELKKIKKKEQELYKFILQQFMDLEDYKKKFSYKISSEVETRVNEIALKGINFQDLSQSIRDFIKENQSLFKGEPGQINPETLNNIKLELTQLINEKILENEQTLLNFIEEKLKSHEQKEPVLEPVEEKEEEQVEDQVEEKEEEKVEEQVEEHVRVEVNHVLEVSMNEDPDIKAGMLKSDNLTIFLRMTNKPKVVLPEPTRELIGKKITILSTCNQTFKISIDNNGKFGTVSEKTLTKNGHYINIICDGQKYFVL